jgi:hypothetical protein
LEGEIKVITPVWKELNYKDDRYDVTRDKLIEENKLRFPELNSTEIKEKVDEIFEKKYPEYKVFKETFNKVNQSYDELNIQLTVNISWKEKFINYSIVIEHHFQSINKPINNARIA